MDAFLKAIGRGLLALGRFTAEILGHLVRESARGLGAGLNTLLRTAGPWLVGAVALYGLWVYRPDFVIGIVQLGVFGAVVVYGFRMIFKGLFPKKKGGGK